MAESQKMPVVEGNGAAEAIFDQGFRYTFGLMSPGRINLFKPMAVEQNQTDGGIYTVGPSAEAERPMQYPAPSWNER
jgi:hypothetical protein